MGWEDWGHSRASVCASPQWRWRQGTVPHNSRRNAHSFVLEPLIQNKAYIYCGQTGYRKLERKIRENIFNDFTDNLTYQQDPTLRWQCNCWYLHPSPLSPETNPRMSRNQTSGHIFGHQTGTNAHRCGRCSWKSLLWWETLKDAERLAFIHIVLHL